jgi:predicted phage tail protein
MNLENQVIPSEVQINKRGQWFAFIMGLVLIAASTATILHGSVPAGTILIALVFLGYLTVYMGGKVSMKADLKKKKASGDFDPKK